MNAPAAITSIVIATDFSEPASVAMAWGRRLSAMHKARIVLVHATGGASDRDLKPDEAAKAMAGLATPMREEGVPAEVELTAGAPAKVLRDAATRYSADILVIGSHGHGALKRLLLGSVADELLKTSTVPLLVVHPPDARRPIRFQTGLVGVDFGDAAQRAAALALRTVMPETDAKLMLLAATQLPMAFVGADAPAMPLIETAEVDEPAREGIKRLVGELGGHGVAIEGLVCPGAPGEAILDTAEDRNVDFITLGSEARKGAGSFLLGSVAMDVVHHAKCPVLVARS